MCHIIGPTCLSSKSMSLCSWALHTQPGAKDPGKMSDLFDLIINKFSIHFEITIHMSTIYIL